MSLQSRLKGKTRHTEELKGKREILFIACPREVVNCICSPKNSPSLMPDTERNNTEFKCASVFRGNFIKSIVVVDFSLLLLLFLLLSFPTTQLHQVNHA